MSFIRTILKINHVANNGQKFCLPGWTFVAGHCQKNLQPSQQILMCGDVRCGGVYNHVQVHPGFVRDVTELDSIGAKDFVNAALACGECDSIREVLISKLFAG